jgi:prepilin-type N-terminal cleavage/methylation domain-containing protein
MGSATRNSGYTLIEVVIALVLFTVGGLALAASSAVIAHGMAANATRERAGRIASSALELLESQCRTAADGREYVQQIESEWSVARLDSSRVTLVESVRYMSPNGMRVDTYRVTVPCRS